MEENPCGVSCETSVFGKRATSTEADVLLDEIEQWHPGISQRANVQKRYRLNAVHRVIDELPEPLRAVCLSGGGIRSATFCLGVLQALAQPARGKRLLDAFHYLSSVSGGGYVGSSLTAWITRAVATARSKGKTSAEGYEFVMDELARSVNIRTDQANSPPAPAREGASDEMTRAEQFITRLRAYSNYLAPRRGMSRDSWSLVALYLRNLGINAMILLPFLLGVLMLPRLTIALSAWSGSPDGLVGAAVATVLAITCAGVFIYASIAGRVDPEKRTGSLGDQLLESNVWTLCGIAIALACCWKVVLPGIQSFAEHVRWYAGALVVATSLGAVAYRRQVSLSASGTCKSATKRTHQALFVLAKASLLATIISVVALAFSNFDLTNSDHVATATALVCVPAIMLVYIVGVLLWTLGAARWASEYSREWWAAQMGMALFLAVVWLLLHGAVVYLPVAVLKWGGDLPISLMTGGGLAGVLVVLGGYAESTDGGENRRRRSGLFGTFVDLLLNLAAVIFIVALITAGGLLSAALVGSQASVAETRATRIATPTHREATRALQSILIGSEKDGALLEDSALRTAAQEVISRAARHDLGGYDNRLGIFLREFGQRWTSMADSYSAGIRNANFRRVASLTGIAFLLAVAVSALAGVNRFSIHALYANRLTRAYLGASRQGKRSRDFDTADDIMLQQVAAARDEGPKRTFGLYPVVNAALNLTAESRLDWQQRKAASWVFTPDYAGSSTLRYTRLYDPDGLSPGNFPRLSLGKTMSISGAAASSNMGYHTSPLVSFVMTLFNARLGWWFPNPARSLHDGGVLSKFRTRAERPAREPGPIGLASVNEEPLRAGYYLLSELFGRANEKMQYVYLSDGGHFENLGVYEMLKRRCRTILVIDAGCDPEYDYEDLANLIRKARTDLGVKIHFDEDTLPRIHARPDRGYHIARVKFPATDGGNEQQGCLIYIKPVLPPDAPEDVRRYAALHAEKGKQFPHQPTADQFFDEAQFEAYRMLGFYLGEQLRDRINEDLDAPPPADCWAGTGQHGDNEPAYRPQASAPTHRGSAQDSGASSARGLFTEISTVAGSLGTAVPMVSALAVGGIVGVAGTVAIAPGTRVALDSGQLTKDVRELQETLSGYAEQIDTAKGEIDSAKAVIDDFNEKYGSLTLPGSAQIGELSEQTARFYGDFPNGLPTTDMTVAINRLNGTVAGFTTIVPAFESLSGKYDDVLSNGLELKMTNSDLERALRRAISEAKLQLEGLYDSQLSDLRDAISSVSRELDELRLRIDGVSGGVDLSEPIGELAHQIQFLSSAIHPLPKSNNPEEATDIYNGLTRINSTLERIEQQLQVIGPRRGAIVGREGAR